MQGHGGNLSCMLGSIADGKPTGHHVCIPNGFNLERAQKTHRSPQGRHWTEEEIGLDNKTPTFPDPLLKLHSPKLDSC